METALEQMGKARKTLVEQGFTEQEAFALVLEMVRYGIIS